MARGGAHRSCLGRLLKIAFLAVGLTAAGLGGWALLNAPPSSVALDRDQLSPLEIVIVRESQHLRAAVGAALWPGFGAASLPVQLYNDRFAFLLGMEGPPGWTALDPGRGQEAVYYRSEKPERQAFAVRIGGRWVGSLTAKESMDAGMPRSLREKIGPFARLVPYRLFIPSSDQYVTFLLHEQFHAFQAESNPRRFDRAEGSGAARSRYPWSNAEYRAAWLEEVRLLQAALAAGDRRTRVATARQFLDRRRARQDLYLQDAALLVFERETEWLEGLAKYVELRSWQLASRPGYQPLAEVRSDPQFHGYGGYDARWSSERISMKLSVNLHGDLPFYWTGALQAMLLDELDGSWKTDFLPGDLFLDAALARASSGHGVAAAQESGG